MPMFAIDMVHSPEMCPMYNEKVKMKFKEQAGRMKEMAANLDIKILINVSSPADHTILVVVDAPSLQAAENFIMEMGMVSFNTVTFRHVVPSEDVIKRF